MKIIYTKFATKCADANCGTEIAVGTKVKWYGRGKVYGIGCHDKPSSFKSTSWVATTSSGAEIYQSRLGVCEDAPCCGCCGVNEFR
jgi:hypothetical protein